MITSPTIQGALRDRADVLAFELTGSGAPSNGASGTGAGTVAGLGAVYLDSATGNRYTNYGTLASPIWVKNSDSTAPVPITANGAIAVRPGGTYAITKASVATMTLAAPTAGAPSAGGDDGLIIEVYSSTAFAHTITANGLLQTGSDAQNSVTFNPFAGASVGFMAYGGKWIIIDPIGVTFA